jgi:hypothetical protein
MRNLIEYPITKYEVMSLLKKKLQRKSKNQGVGDINPYIASRIVEFFDIANDNQIKHFFDPTK